MTITDLILSITTAYADLYVRQEAIVHVGAELLKIPGEVLETALQDWRRENYDRVGREANERIRSLLRGTGVVPFLPEVPPTPPLTF